MPINATFHGFVETTTDALLLFEACHQGVLPKISRRLQERERGSIKSGTVFIFDEKESGIKRWTDGLIWSPSRILGNFLIYRELGGRESLNNDNKVPTANNPVIDYNDRDTYVHQQLDSNNYGPFQRHDHNINQHDYYQQNGNPNFMQSNAHFSYEEQVQYPLEKYNDLDIEDREIERNLVGSLTDTYKFRKGGLIKKTLSIQINGGTQHMISYYTKEDVLRNRLATPSSISEISSLTISSELLLKQSFRVPPSVEFAEMTVKRPSLSPSSTGSSTTSSSTSPLSHHSRRVSSTSYHPYYQNQQFDDQTPGRSRRKVISVDSLSPSLPSNKNSFKRGNDNTNGNAAMTVDSILSYPPPNNISSEIVHTTMPNESLPDINNRSSCSFDNYSTVSRSFYEDSNEAQAGQYHHSSQRPYFENNKGKIQRRHSNYHYNNSSNNPYYNVTGSRRQNSCHFSSPPNFNNYEQRTHNIPTISSLPSPSFQQNQSSPPLVLSPSRFLWSAHDDHHLMNEKASMAATTRDYPPPPTTTPSDSHYRHQRSFPYATAKSAAANNSLPRCFETVGKLALSGVNNSPYNENSALIQNNMHTNFCYQEQQQQNHQQQQEMLSINFNNHKQYE